MNFLVIRGTSLRVHKSFLLNSNFFRALILEFRSLLRSPILKFRSLLRSPILEFLATLHAL